MYVLTQTYNWLPAALIMFHRFLALTCRPNTHRNHDQHDNQNVSDVCAYMSHISLEWPYDAAACHTFVPKSLETNKKHLWQCVYDKTDVLRETDQMDQVPGGCPR